VELILERLAAEQGIDRVVESYPRLDALSDIHALQRKGVRFAQAVRQVPDGIPTGNTLRQSASARIVG